VKSNIVRFANQPLCLKSLSKELRDIVDDQLHTIWNQWKEEFSVDSPLAQAMKPQTYNKETEGSSSHLEGVRKSLTHIWNKEKKQLPHEMVNRFEAKLEHSSYENAIKLLNEGILTNHESNKNIMRFWNEIQNSIGDELTNSADLPTTATEIKSWLADPKNQTYLNKITQLTLWMNKIPEEIEFLPNLKSLCLIQMIEKQLKDLPLGLAKLNELEELEISQLSFTVIPPVLFDCKNLKKLSFRNNRLTEFPIGFENLKNLEGLEIASNSITVIPREIKELKKLTYLNLTNNQITDIPSDLGEMTNLQDLFLGNNFIQNLPARFGELSQLKTLDLSYNQLTEIPSQVLGLTQLKTLILNSSGFGTLAIFGGMHLWRNRYKISSNSYTM